jgi:hypothetical protein
VAALQGGALVVHFTNRKNAPLLFSTRLGTRPPAQTVEAPKYSIGDEWRYDKGTIRVVAVDGETYAFENTMIPNCPGCRWFFDANRTLLKVFDKDGKPVDQSTVGLKLMEFPMSVGKTWTANQLLRQRNTPDLVPFDNTFTIVAYEDVKTKAGTFKAFKISWEQENKATYRSWRGRLVRWYSREVKNWIKQEVFTTNWFDDFELQSYLLK